MKQLFVDTSAWIATVDRSDKNHKKAAAFYQKALIDFGKLLATDLVLAETYTILRLTMGIDTAFSWWDRILSSPRIELIFSDQTLFEDAGLILKKYSDQAFSLADAVSFVVMNQKNINEAFAFDKHFIVAGFSVSP